MKTQALFLTFVMLAAIEASAFENTDFKSVAEGRTDYICSVARENPKEKGAYDQKVAYGGAFINGSSDSLMITRTGKVVNFNVADLKTQQELAELEGALFVGMNLTQLEDAKTDQARNITIAVGQMRMGNGANKRQVEIVKPIAMAGGYHKGVVLLIAPSLRLAVTCFHRSAAGL